MGYGDVHRSTTTSVGLAHACLIMLVRHHFLLSDQSHGRSSMDILVTCSPKRGGCSRVHVHVYDVCFQLALIHGWLASATLCSSCGLLLRKLEDIKVVSGTRWLHWDRLSTVATSI